MIALVWSMVVTPLSNTRNLWN